MSGPLVARAPGKIILLGEHAVVYGEPAIGVPLSRGVSVSIQPGRGAIRVLGEVPARSKTAATPTELVRAAFGGRADDVDLSISFEIPPMAGLGSSAALAVALLRARGGRVSLKEAIAIEDVAHGRSSGVDPAIALASGPIYFQKRRSRALKIGAPFFLIAGAKGGHGGTGRSVGRVAEMKKQAPRLITSAMRALGETTRTGVTAIAAGELALLGSAMELAHGILSGLALVSSEVEEVVRAARAAGAIGAKMSGAGGRGGAFVALAADRRAAKKILDRVISLGALAWIEPVRARSPHAARTR